MVVRVGPVYLPSRKVLQPPEFHSIFGRRLCRGKQWHQWAPVPPETTQLVFLLADGLSDDEQVFRGERGRDEGLGYDGMWKLVRGLMDRAGLPGFTGHNLRGTLVTLFRSGATNLP